MEIHGDFHVEQSWASTSSPPSTLIFSGSTIVIMLIKRAHKVELSPNKVQELALAKSAGVARFAYNYGLELHARHYKETGKHLSAVSMHKILCAEKKDKFPWMYEVSKCAPQEAFYNVEAAFINFFKKRSAHPKFKKKGRSKDSFTLDNSVFNTKSIRGRGVHLPKIGTVRCKEILSIEGRILSATVSKDADRWFISVMQEVEIDLREEDKPKGNPIGIDLGIKTLVTTSDGEEKQEFVLPYYLDTEEKKIKRAQKRLSKKAKKSKNWFKQGIRVARLYRKLRNKRTDFIHKTTTQLAKTKSVIVMEDLNVKGMVKNHCLAKSISNAAFGEIKRQLEYKTIWYGSELIMVSRWFPSSKMCSACGFIKKDLSLSERTWICPDCHTEHERDFNAATNILVEGLKINTVSHTGINACGDGSSFVDSSTNQPVVETRRGQSSILQNNGGVSS
jgi:putative transposase